MKMKIRKGERGVAFSIIMVQVSLALVLFFIALISIGKITENRDTTQNRVDGIAAAASDIIRYEGTGALCNGDARALYQAIWEANPAATENNFDCPTITTQENGDTQTRSINIAVSNRYEAPFEFGEDHVINRQAGMEIEETMFEDVELRRPKFVLVLDYSGSMGADFGGRSRISSLRAAVTGLLDQDLDIEYGLVTFSTGIMDVIGVAYDEDQDLIRDAIRRGAGGGTNYGPPIDRARSLLTSEEDTGYHILFISDGIPGDGNAGLAAANAARARDVTLFTLLIGSDGGAAARLRAIAGPPGDPGADGYYFRAGNDASLQRTFSDIVASVLCAIGPLEGIPEDYDIAGDDPLYVLLEGPDGEVPIPRSLTLNAEVIGENTKAFMWVGEEGKIRLSGPACDLVVKQGYKVIARWGRPELVD